jgi:hypothetical protein
VVAVIILQFYIEYTYKKKFVKSKAKPEVIDYHVKILETLKLRVR